MISKLSTIPDRHQVGLGSMLNPNHDGGVKRVTETRLMGEIDELTASDIRTTAPSPEANQTFKNKDYKG